MPAVAPDVDRVLLVRRRELLRAQGRRRLALLIGVLLLVAGVGGYAALRGSSAFAVRTVRVEGADAGLASQVRSEVAAEVHGRSLLALDSGTIARLVERLPAVRSASVDRAFPHRLRIVVHLYRPAAAVAVGWGRHARRYLLAGDGHVLDGRAHPPRGLVRVQLPRGSALVVGRVAGSPDVRAVLAVMHQSERFRSLFGRLRRVRARAGTVMAEVGRRLELRLGLADRIGLKLRVAARVLRRIGSEQRQTIAYLDVSVPGRPALGLRSNAPA